MIHVVLDTNIFRSDPCRKKAPFRVLSRLASDNRLKLHVPYIVEREFVTGQIQEHGKPINQLESALNKLARKKLPENIEEKIKEYKEGCPEIREQINHHIELDLLTWLHGVNAERHPLDQSHTRNVFDAYFKGTPPFKDIKSRKDIPDAFIFESIKKLLNELPELHVVIEDKAFREACDELEKVQTYESLENFINSPIIKSVLGKLEQIEKLLESIINKLKADTNELDLIMGGQVDDKLNGEMLKDYRIPDDNHEATISSVSDPEDFEYFFDETHLVGDDIIIIPFRFETFVNTYYYIFKADFYAIETERTKHISTSDHNDHYYEAEEEFTIEVFGELSLQLIPEWDDNFEEIWEIIESDKCEIENIKDINILDQLGEY